MPNDSMVLEVTGIAELNARLLEIASPDKVYAWQRKALRAAAEVIQKAIQERAPIKAEDERGGKLPRGALANDIEVHVRVEPNTGLAYATIGPGKYTFMVARWVEYGHRGIEGGYSRLKKDGTSRGPGVHTHDVPAYPFIRPAFEASIGEAIKVAQQTLLAEINRERRPRQMLVSA